MFARIEAVVEVVVHDVVDVVLLGLLRRKIVLRLELRSVKPSHSRAHHARIERSGGAEVGRAMQSVQQRIIVMPCVLECGMLGNTYQFVCQFLVQLGLQVLVYILFLYGLA